MSKSKESATLDGYNRSTGSEQVNQNELDNREQYSIQVEENLKLTFPAPQWISEISKHNNRNIIVVL